MNTIVLLKFPRFQNALEVAVYASAVFFLFKNREFQLLLLFYTLLELFLFSKIYFFPIFQLLMYGVQSLMPMNLSEPYQQNKIWHGR